MKNLPALLFPIFVAIGFFLASLISPVTQAGPVLSEPEGDWPSVQVGAYQQWSSSYLFNYSVISQDPVTSIRLSSDNCFYTEAGSWSNWTPCQHIDLEIWGHNSYLEYDNTIAYWEPNRHYINFYLLTLEPRAPVPGVIYINGAPYDTTVPDCDNHIYLPVMLNDTVSLDCLPTDEVLYSQRCLKTN